MSGGQRWAAAAVQGNSTDPRNSEAANGAGGVGTTAEKRQWPGLKREGPLLGEAAVYEIRIR